LAPLADHGLVSEVRAGLGVLAGVQLAPDALADDPTLSDRVVLSARERGVLTRGLVGGGLQVSPSLVIDRAGLAELATGLVGALDDVVVS
jgi:adenosylmethionine-8-amino-7-oxononanoate aminotransferase